MSRAGVSMNLRTKSGGKVGRAAGAKVKAGPEPLESRSSTLARRMMDPASVKTLEDQLRAVREAVAADRLCAEEREAVVGWFFALRAKSAVRKVVSSSLNRLNGQTSPYPGIFCAYLKRLVAEDTSLDELASAVLRCFETCYPAKEAAVEVGSVLVDAIVKGIAECRDVGLIGNAARGLLCLLPDHCNDCDADAFIKILSETLSRSCAYPPDTKLNLILCLIFKLSLNDRFCTQVHKMLDGEDEETFILTKYFRDNETRISLLHGFLVALPARDLLSQKSEGQDILLAKISTQLQQTCERVQESSETLQYSRAMLQLATRVDGLCSDLDHETLLSLIASLLDFTWRMIESSLDSARHNVKNTLTKVLKTLQATREVEATEKFLADVMAIPWRSRSKYAVLGVVVRDPALRPLLTAKAVNLPEALLTSSEDPTISGHCAELYKLCLKEYRPAANADAAAWAERWIDPLLTVENESQVEVRMNILSAALSLNDKAVDFVSAQMSRKTDASEEELLVALAVLKTKKKAAEGWKEYLNEGTFRWALNHYSDKVRLAALSCIIESRSSAELFSVEETKAILWAIENNLKLEEASDRQDFLTWLKKMLNRFTEGQQSKRMDASSHECYNAFLLDLENLLSRQIFPGANSDRRLTSLKCALLRLEVIPPPSGEFFSRRYLESLVTLLDDGYVNARECALELLLKLRQLDDSVDGVIQDALSWEDGLADCAALSPALTTGAPYKATLLLRSRETRKALGLAFDASLEEVMVAGLQTLLRLVKTTLSGTERIDRDSPVYGLLSCMRKLLADLNKEHPQSSDTLKAWAHNIVLLKEEISSKTAYVLESDSPEGFCRPDESAVEVQADLLCAWRASKELSLLLSDLFVTPGLLSHEQQAEVVRFFCHLLEVTIHRGSFEQAYAGFVAVCSALWNSADPRSQALLRDLLDGTLESVRSRQFLATRRSAGIPFLVQALIASQPPTTTSMPFVASTMRCLLDVGATSDEVLLRVQAFNILRGLYRNNNLGENIGSFVEDGMQLAFTGFRSAIWSERNAASLLFSALVTRVFGVKRGRDEFSARNLMASRHFFQRYPAMHGAIGRELREGAGAIAGKTSPAVLHPRETALFPALVVLAKLKPSPACTGSDKWKATDFLPHLVAILGSSVSKIRDLAARVLAHLLPGEALGEAERVSTRSANKLHGVILMVEYHMRSSTNAASSEHGCRFTECVLRLAKTAKSMPRCFPLRAALLDAILTLLMLHSPNDGDKKQLLALVTEFLEGIQVSEGPTRPGQQTFLRKAAMCLMQLGRADVVIGWIKECPTDFHRAAAVEAFAGSEIDEDGDDDLSLKSRAFSSPPPECYPAFRDLFISGQHNRLSIPLMRGLAKMTAGNNCGKSELLPLALRSMEQCTQTVEITQAIRLASALLHSNGEKDSLCRFFSSMERLALSTDYGNEAVREAAAEAVFLNADLIQETKGPWVLFACRLLFSFACDDQPHVRHLCLKTVRAFGFNGDFPSETLMGNVVTALLLELEDNASVAVALCEVMQSSNDEESDDVTNGVFEKSGSSSWREDAVVRRQLEAALQKWTSNCGGKEVRVPEYLLEDWIRVKQSGETLTALISMLRD